MRELTTGMLARSKAGHDAGRLYMIIKADEEYVYLADGTLRTLERLKKKKRKHIQADFHISIEVKEILMSDARLQNETIKKILKEYSRKQEV